MVDVQYTWDDAERALATLNQWKDLGIFFCETPLPLDDLDGIGARLAGRSERTGTILTSVLMQSGARCRLSGDALPHPHRVRRDAGAACSDIPRRTSCGPRRSCHALGIASRGAESCG